MMKTIQTSIAVLFLLLFFTGCSDNNPSLTDDTGKSGKALERLIVDDTRVTVYSQAITSHAAASASASASATSIPEIPTGVLPMYSHTSKANQGESFIIKPGETFNGEVIFYDNTYYVQGKMTVTNHYGKPKNVGGGTIYVMPGGELIMKSSPLLINVTIISTGSIVLPDNFEINEGGTLKTNHSIQNKNLKIAGTLYCEGDVDVTTFHTIKNSVAEVHGCLTATNYVYIDNYSSLKIASYLSTKQVKQMVEGKLLLNSKSYVSCKTLDESNAKTSIINEGDDYAVIECNEYIIRHADQTLNTGWLDIHAGKITNNSGKNLTWLSTVKFNGDTYIPAGSCSPEFGEPTTPPEISYKLDHIAKVNSIATEISATSIGFESGKAYVSWHKYGDPIDGYIDVIDMGSIRLEATLHNEELDFNHICVRGKDIYVAGGNKKGAFIGSVNYSDAALSLDITQLEGASGNCLLVEENTTWAVSGSQGGLSIINGNNIRFIEIPAAKYILNQAGNMVLLSGIDHTKLSYYNTNGQLLQEYPLGSITPGNGKNAMATDGETIYVALGQNGVKALRNGVEVAVYDNYIELEPAAAANCVDVDEKYVYVANGLGGLYILHKSDLSLVCKYSLGDASANFVKKGEDGLIYVSYGLKGVNVFRLIEQKN